MPPAKKATKKTTAKKRAKKTLSPAHKRALAEGRTISATVDRYLLALNTPKTRGRKVSTASLEQRLTRARKNSKTATGVQKVLAAQEVRELQTRLSQRKTSTGVDVKALEAAFVKVAKRFGDNRGISYGAWRASGVPAVVLKRAGIPRTRG